VVERIRKALAVAAQENVTDRVASIDNLRYAQAMPWRCHPESPLLTLLQFEMKLREPVETWLADDVRGLFTGALIDNDAVTDLCQKWLAPYQSK
jgi:hypothetical protein